MRTGKVSGSPEVYEKIDPDTGRGVVSLFAGSAGRYTYVTRTTALSPKFWHNDAVSLAYDKQGRAHIEAHFPTAGAKLVFFGVRS